MDWKGRDNPFVGAVQAISIDGEGQEARTPEEQEQADMRGEVVAADWRDDPRNPQGRAPRPDGNRLVHYGPAEDDVIPAWVIEGDGAAAGRNAGGSYEALRAGWGAGGRTAFETPK